jgi:hypothetical protein
MQPRRHRPHPLARCHAAVLAWAVLMLVLTPVGATLHAMTHLGQAPLRVLAAMQAAAGTAAKAAGESGVGSGSNLGSGSNIHSVSNFGTGSTISGDANIGDAAYHADVTTAAADDDDGQGPDAHCHTCDEWQLLDHVLTPAPLLVLPPPSLLPHTAAAPRPALLARSPWILPRAPPA